MRRALLLLHCALLSSCLPQSFSIDDAGPLDAGIDSGPLDARVPEDSGLDVGSPDVMELRDAGGPDAAPFNHVNVACPLRWTDIDEEAPAGCAGRRVSVVGDALAPSALDIAVLESQSVALAWNSNTNFDSGGMELRVLGADLQVIRSASIEPEAVIGEVVGTSISIVPEGEDVHLGYWLRSDFGSTIEYRRWSSELLSPAETINPVGRSGTVRLGLGGRGGITFAFHDLVMGRHFSRTRLRDSTLEASIELAEDFTLVPVDSPAVALVERDGISHVAYRRRFGDERAAPFYRRRVDGGGWSVSSTVDSVGTSRYSGIALDIAAFGDKVAIVYLEWSAGQTEVRLATWDTTPDEVEVQVLTMYGAEEAPVYTPLDIEFDAFGLLHLLFADDAGNRTLEYWRERVGGNGWVRDTIVELSREADLRAHIVVGQARQPHIVFAARGDIHYATITP